MTFSTSLQIPELNVMMAFAGFILGVCYFAALRQTAALLATDRNWLGPLALTLGRVAAAVLVLGLAARLGALSLLLTFLGFLLARALALHAAKRTG